MNKDFYKASDHLADYIGEHQNENPDFLAVHLYADKKMDKCGCLVIGQADELESLIFATMASKPEFAIVVVKAVERFAKLAEKILSKDKK